MVPGAQPDRGPGGLSLGAQAFRLNGWAMLQCRVAVAGALEDCQVLAQEPRRLGFGAAGLKVAGSYRLDPDLMAQGRRATGSTCRPSSASRARPRLSPCGPARPAP
uniref:Uncharacterized protein n=1 Tax=Phenylobacterium glaciei TaxID=2803784 RepID=A0A974P388_9CAUL|nr:hypothetical protein JKL49_02160 [Phenylobacterium glaciei]